MLLSRLREWLDRPRVADLSRPEIWRRIDALPVIRPAKPGYQNLVLIRSARRQAAA